MILDSSITVLDFGQNKHWTESERLGELARILWKIIGEKCHSLKKFIITKELSYSSTLNSVILNNSNLTHLTLKRNVPTNMFLALIGQSCPNLKELDIAGAEVITDFGIICLLFSDPEEIFTECWNREKTVGSVRRSQRAFPHPHFDKQIHDPADANAEESVLYLKKSFHEVIKDKVNYNWGKLPVVTSLQKIRLENTKVKGDGASVILETCPNIYSLGYLVFAAAGLKQVFGYETGNPTNFTEIFYRGPSDQKLQTIANCCPKLSTMFLGSNTVRRMNVRVFHQWHHLEYLTLENIKEYDISGCLEIIGKQLKGLKIQCSGFDLTDVAIYCPNLLSMIIQKEVPLSTISASRAPTSSFKMFGHLRHLEVTSSSFSKACFNYIMRHAKDLRSIKVLHVPGLRRQDIDSWCLGPDSKLETLIIFKAPELNREAVEILLDTLPNLKVFGDIHSFDLVRPSDVKRLLAKIKDEKWDLQLVDSSDSANASGVVNEREFSKLLSLHWFYLTETPANKRNQEA